MPRTRRYIIAGRPYELDIRVKSGLPFACFKTIKLLLMSAMARAQRDAKITICHHLWQGNHLHMLLIPYDAELCTRFYQELQKKITEYMKRLLGVRRLNLWEGDAVLAEVDDMDQAMGRIAYYYANPAEANLTDTIEEYPGLSSWWDFVNADDRVDAKAVHRIPWIRQPAVARLSSLSLSAKEDTALCQTLSDGATLHHDLEIYPHAWLGCFGVRAPEEIAAVKARTIQKLRALEEQHREQRKAEGKRVMGAEALRRQAIMTAHTPPPRERRVYVLASDPEVRIARIEATKIFCRICDACYRAEREGRMHAGWPPGAIRPYQRPVANAVVDITQVIA